MMNVALAKTETGRAMDRLFAVARERLPGAGKVAEARGLAFEAYERLGLPHRRIEEWKYTDLRALIREVLPLGATPDAAAIARARAAVKAHRFEGATVLAIVDGVFVPELSDTPHSSASVETLRERLEGGASDLLDADAVDAMISLNAALATDGVLLSIADGSKLASPIQIIHVATAASASLVSRSYLRLGRAARLSLVESYVAAEGAKDYQVNDALIISVGDEAELSLVRLMADNADAVNVTSGIISIGARAKLDLFNMTSGGAVSRYQGFITLAGEDSRLFVNGVNLLKGRQHGDTTVVVDHAVPGCTSREMFRAVVDDRAHSVFQGRIIVRPDAQKTDGKMETRALLLSDEAEADNKPELEIFADDVTCGHGATAGALDDNLLFYLRARGLSEKDAQALLIQAFVGEATEQIADENLREAVMGLAQRWLEARS
jgi:Fe-S cluster assembly protein SufD